MIRVPLFSFHSFSLFRIVYIHAYMMIHDDVLYFYIHTGSKIFSRVINRSTGVRSDIEIPMSIIYKSDSRDGVFPDHPYEG